MVFLFLVDDIGLEPMTFRTSKVFVPFGMSQKGKKDPIGTYLAQSERLSCRIFVVLVADAMSDNNPIILDKIADIFHSKVWCR